MSISISNTKGGFEMIILKAIADILIAAMGMFDSIEDIVIKVIDMVASYIA